MELHREFCLSPWAVLPLPTGNICSTLWGVLLLPTGTIAFPYRSFASPYGEHCFFLRGVLLLPVGNIAFTHGEYCSSSRAELGAVTHSTVNGISRGKFYRGASHVEFRIPRFQRLHADSGFPRQHYRKIHSLSREFCVKVHAKTNIARIAKRWVRYRFSSAI